MKEVEASNVDGPDGVASSQIVGALALLSSPHLTKIRNDDRLP